LEEAVLHAIRNERSLTRERSGLRIRTTITCISVSFFLLLISLLAAQGQEDRRVLRTIHEVNQLTNIEARNAYSVRL